jgi:ATP-binding cassette, subfamily B, heavy metal transporter
MKLGVRASMRELARLILRSGTHQLRLRLAAAIALIVLGPLATVWAPVVLGDAINLLVSSDHTATVSYGFFLGTVISFALAAFSSLTPDLRLLIFMRVSESTMAQAAVEAFRHTMTLSIDFHQSKQSGSLIRIIDRGIRAIDVLIRGVVFGIGPTIIELTLALGVMFVRLDWRLALTALAGVVVFLILTFYLNRQRLSHRRELNEADTSAGGLLADALMGYETVKTFGAEERVVEAYRLAMCEYVNASLRANDSLVLLRVVEHGIVRLCMAAVVIMAGVAVTDGLLRIGDVFTAVFLLRGLFAPLEILGTGYRDILQAFTDMEQLVDLKAAQSLIRDSPSAGDLPPAQRQGATVVFEQVTFQYDARSEGGLKDISFEIPPGSTFAIVGPSGAGKTTLVRLLTRLIDPQSGHVMVDGIDLRRVRQASVHHEVAVVPQDVTLFNDTLSANIAFGRPEGHPNEVRAAAEAAGLGAFIESLPLGMSTVVGERGLKLSGGERQRVGLARALLAHPRVLILDEATSALDGPTEAVIQATLGKARTGRTTLIIAHRLSTIVDADQILVLDRGTIVERGTHTQLLACAGEYVRLWSHQIRENRCGSSEFVTSVSSFEAKTPATPDGASHPKPKDLLSRGASAYENSSP